MRVLILLFIALGASLAGWLLLHHKTARTADGRVVIEYWEKWTGAEGDAMQAIVDDFNKSQNRIYVNKLTVSAIDQKLMLATAGGNPPDVAGLWSHTIPTYAEKGALTPLDSMLKEASITRGDYVPVFWDICSARGFMWALPTTPASVALHWNKTRFREAGLDPEKPPTSLAELDAMAEKLTVVNVVRSGKREQVRFPDLTPDERASKKFDIVRLGFSPTEPGWWTAMWPVWFGGRIWDGESKITAYSRENVATFNWYRSYADKYGLDNMRKFGASFGNFSSPQNPFLSGDIAMTLQGVWMYNYIQQYAPKLEWGAAAFPSIDPVRLQNVTIVECDAIVIPKGSAHPKEAFEFMRYVNSQPAMEKLNLLQRKISPLAHVSDDFVQRHPNPYIKVYIDLSRSANVNYMPRMPIWNEFSDEMVNAADRIFSGNAPVEQGLKDVDERIQWKLDRVMKRWSTVKDTRLKEWSGWSAN